MATKQCDKGHLYDDRKDPACPYCTGKGDVGVLRPLTPPAGADAPVFPKTSPAAGAGIPGTLPLNNPEINKTMALGVNEKGINPVCGWLICVAGEKKGKDFRIVGEKNYIGRMPSNDICLDFDNSISKESSATVNYDMRTNKFFIQPGDGKNNVYHNGELLLAPAELKEYDTIEIGRTKLIFRSLCNNQFKWE